MDALILTLLSEFFSPHRGKGDFLDPHSGSDAGSGLSSGLKKRRDTLLPCGVTTTVTKSDEGSHSLIGDALAGPRHRTGNF